MKLRTRLNLVVAGLTATFVAVLIGEEIRSTRLSLREEIAAANRVASQLLGRLAESYSREGGAEQVQQFLDELGRVRANDITLTSEAGEVLYRSPPPTYKAGRTAPAWFSELLAPEAPRNVFALPGGNRLTVQAEVSRAVLDAWDDLLRLLAVAGVMLVLVNGLALWLVDRALAPFPVIAAGLARLEGGDLSHRLPPLAGFEARTIGSAFNRMAQAVQDKVSAERKARDAELRLEERRELARIVDQRLEEERRVIAHELHDEFGQSVTAIRALAQAIAVKAGAEEPATRETAELISAEAARLYDNMHGLIPRLTPFALDTLGLAVSLENLVRDWQRRFPAVALSVRHEIPADLGPSAALAIYRVVQEGLINALRHARASRVDVAVSADTRRIAVSVRDDGVGLPEDWSRAGHFGLRGLAERVGQLGGTFAVANAAKGGVELTAELPLGCAA
ncbi:MAG TPA: ATP-binding protein [Gammaproteobacteria bacterium]|nr:ATP-binding protein [Gammaproteobacteria bacterium]